jgi:molybdopterin-containing oxidoreductase family iron-sulfur binding subunit
MSRRSALGVLAGGIAAGTGAAMAAQGALTTDDGWEVARLKFQEYIKGNYRVMSAAERQATIARLERLARLQHGTNVQIGAAPAREGVLFGYAFNISKCKGFLECVAACVKENNQDRSTDIQYIKIFELKRGELALERGRADYFHQVPVPGNYYLGTQCFQCENPPCTDVCPVGATWKEPDGIVVIDYDWCIGCRYCVAACPYWARRFNWKTPEIPQAEVNPDQHYLGNRPRKRGVVEKCTFCIQRTRQGRNPACVEACPTGARVFGNLLDPDSEIRWVLEHKKVFRLKEALGTEPKFWYFAD